MEDYFTKYPRLNKLYGKVPDEVIKRELNQKIPMFEHICCLAQGAIPEVRLCDVFSEALERGRIVLEHFLGHWGNISIEEICKICLIAVGLKPSAVFEFGTYNGMTTKQIALNTKEDCKIKGFL